MSVTPGGQRTDLNGVTAVTVVPAPAAGVVRTILVIRVYQGDTVVHGINIQSNISGTKKVFDKIAGLAPTAPWKPVMRDQVKVLPDVNTSIEIFMDEAMTTTNPHVEAEWVDKTTAAAPSGIIVEAADGVPSYTGIVDIQFDEADGFALSNPSAGVAKIKFSGGGGGGSTSFWSIAKWGRK